MVSDVLATFWFTTPILGYISLGTWMYMDATNRGITPALVWTAATLVFPPILLLYLYERRQTRPRESPSTYQRAAATGAWAVGIAVIVVAVLTPPDPLSQMRYYTIVLPVALVVMYLLVYRGGFRRLWLVAEQ